MGGIELGELMNVAMDLLLLPLLIAVLFKGRVPHARTLLSASLCIVFSHIATILEGFFLPAFFDAVEHLSMLFAGLLYLRAVVRLGRFLDARRRPAP